MCISVDVIHARRAPRGQIHKHPKAVSIAPSNVITAGPAGYKKEKCSKIRSSHPVSHPRRIGQAAKAIVQIGLTSASMPTGIRLASRAAPAPSGDPRSLNHRPRRGVRRCPAEKRPTRSPIGGPASMSGRGCPEPSAMGHAGVRPRLPCPGRQWQHRLRLGRVRLQQGSAVVLVPGHRTWEAGWKVRSEAGLPQADGASNAGPHPHPHR